MSVAIEFCEPAYATSVYIAEFWNTISSAAYCLVAFVFVRDLYILRKIVPGAFGNKFIVKALALSAAVFTVGVGSGLLHATQTWWGEAVDEAGMVLASLAYLFCLKDLHPLTSGRKRFWFYTSVGLIVSIAVGVYLKIFLHGIFATLFGCLIALIAVLFSTSPVSTKNTKFFRNIQVQSNYRKSIKIGIFFALIGFGAWILDQSCVKNKWGNHKHLSLLFWCHPIWHLSTATCAYIFLKLLLQAKIDIATNPFARTKSGSFVPKKNSLQAAS